MNPHPWINWFVREGGSSGGQAFAAATDARPDKQRPSRVKKATKIAAKISEGATMARKKKTTTTTAERTTAIGEQASGLSCRRRAALATMASKRVARRGRSGASMS